MYGLRYLNRNCQLKQPPCLSVLTTTSWAELAVCFIWLFDGIITARAMGEFLQRDVVKLIAGILAANFRGHSSACHVG